MNILFRTNMLALLLMLGAISLQAKDVRSLWKTVPDSVVQLIDKVRRLEMLDLVDYRVKAEVDNRLGSQSVMDTLTANYLHIQVSKQSELAMRLLPTIDGDTIVCLVHTYKAPMSESSVRFYDLSWRKLSPSRYLPFSLLQQAADSLCCKPDTMSEERFGELCRGIVAVLVRAEINVDNSDIKLSASLPMVDNDKKNAMASIFVSRRLQWNGKRYVYIADGKKKAA